MLRLIESRRERRRQRGATMFSLVAHTLVIVGVVAATAKGSEPEPVAAPGPTPIHFPEMPRSPEHPTPSQPTRPGVPAPVDGPIVVAPIDVPTTIPVPGDPALPPPVFGDPSRDATHPGPLVPGTGVGVPRADSTAAWADQVDRAVVPLGRARVPRYPDVLQRSRQEGSVVALFVVDTLGAVEANSFRAASSTHALFTESVRLVVLSMRFKPAEVAGRPVRQLVQQRFVFELTP